MPLDKLIRGDAKEALIQRLQADLHVVHTRLAVAQEDRVFRQYQGRAQYIEILLKELTSDKP